MVVYLGESWSFALDARLGSGLDEISEALSGTELLIIYVTLFWTLLLGFLPWPGHPGDEHACVICMHVEYTDQLSV